MAPATAGAVLYGLVLRRLRPPSDRARRSNPGSASSLRWELFRLVPLHGRRIRTRPVLRQYYTACNAKERTRGFTSRSKSA
jgi:hypothetical protein